MPAKLIAEEGPVKGLILSFSEGEEWIIGRDPDESLLVVEDSKVSRKHISIHKTLDGLVLENFSSSNPALVNNTPVLEPLLLHSGDTVKIGDSVFRFDAGIGLPEPAFPPEPKIEEEKEPLEAPKQPPYTPPKAPKPPSYTPIETPEEPAEGYETIFKESQEHVSFPPVQLDLTQTGRWLLKVITGPNTGAEFSLQNDNSYVIGTDVSSCDIVFHDLSISRQHARITVQGDDTIVLEDLKSRNGVLVDGKLIEEKVALKSSQMITLGTTSCLVIDKESAQETIISAPLAVIKEPEAPPPPAAEEAPQSTPEATSPKVEEKKEEQGQLAGGAFILLLLLSAIIIIVGAGTLSLFKTQQAVVPQKDFPVEIQTALVEFPSVQFTFNKRTGKLFLLGHVLTGVDKSEILYSLQGLTFVASLEDHIVIDENVWQEMNQILSNNPDWAGVNIYASQPGHFVLQGYLKTQNEAVALNDYINVNFPYLDLLENRVSVEENMIKQIYSELRQQGLSGVVVQLSNGELTLSGMISIDKAALFQGLVDKFKTERGVRQVNNFVVKTSPEEAVVDLSGQYQVTGSSEQGNTSLNVMINGKIIGRGDSLDGMTVTGIKPNTIFLEKGGVKYKIEYNKN